MDALNGPVGQLGVPLAAAGLSAAFPRRGAPAVHAGLGALGAMQDYHINNMRVQELTQHQGAENDYYGKLAEAAGSLDQPTSPAGGVSGNAPAATSALQSSTQDAQGQPAPIHGTMNVDPHELSYIRAGLKARDPIAAKRLMDILAKRDEVSNLPTVGMLPDFDTSRMPVGGSLSGKTREGFEFNFKNPEPDAPHYTELTDASGHKQLRATSRSGASDTTDLGPTAPTSEYDAISRAHPGEDPIALAARLAAARATPEIKESTEGGLYRVNPFGGAAMPVAVGGVPPAPKASPDGRPDFSDVRTGTEGPAPPPQGVHFGGRNAGNRLSPEEADQLGQMLAKPGDPLSLTALKDVAGRSGTMARTQVILAARRYDPNFSNATLERKIKMLDNFTNGKEGQQIRSFGTFLVHAGEAADLNAKFSRTNSPLLNTPLNKLRTATGDPDVLQFATALAPVGTEWMTFLQNNHALQEDDRRVLTNLINGDMSLGQAATVVQQMGHAAGARLGQLNSQFKKQMGVDIPDPLDDAALEGARKIGLNIGDVEPTNKSGHMTNSGGQGGIVSGSGKFRWNGTDWVPNQ